MNLPLHGRRIVVTRARDQAGSLTSLLERLGAEALEVPAIEVAPPEDFAPLDRALGGLAAFSGFIFTSVNGVHRFFARACQLGVTPSGVPARPAGSWVCAIGAATAAALSQQPGWSSDLEPIDSRAEGVVEALAAYPLAGRTILVPRAAAGRDLIPNALARRGARVVTVATHRTLLPPESRTRAQALLPGADAVLFTSPSTGANLAILLGANYQQRLHGVVLAAIGPVTRDSLEKLGLSVAVEAPRATIEDLVQALMEYWHA